MMRPSPRALLLRAIRLSCAAWFACTTLLVAAARAGEQAPQVPRTESGSLVPLPPDGVPPRIVTRRPDDPIYHREVQRRAVSAWSPIRMRTLTPGAPGAVASSTLLSMHSETGDYIGGGRDYLYTPPDGSFSISGTPNHVEVYFSNVSHFWYLEFAAPNNAALAVRNYTGATRYPFNAVTDPGLEVFGDGRGCNQITGAFRVKQITFDATGKVASFWATFEQHCEGGAPVLTGEVRWNADVQIALRAPPSQHVVFGQPLAFDIGASTADSSIATLSASGLPAAATFDDHRNNTGTFNWTPGFDRIGSHTPVAFRAVNTLGAADSATTDVIVDGMTSLIMNSESGDYIGAGQSQTYLPSDGTFSVNTNRNFVGISFSSPTHFWSLSFQAPNGASLAVGSYLNATRYPFNGTNAPGLDVSGDGRGCNTLAGSFVIRQISFAPNGSLASFRAAFEQHCEGGAPALTGEIRWNAAVAVDMSAPLTRSVEQGKPLAVDVTAKSFDGSHVTLSATGLPAAATFTDHGDDTGTLRWTPTFNDIGRNSLITFRGSTASGLADSTSTRVSVTGLTSLRMSSDPGEWIGQGQDYNFTPIDGAFSLRGDRRHVTATFNNSSFSGWNLEFASPSGVDLAVGTYLNVARYPFNTPTQAGLSITGPGRGCNSVTGSFRIKQITFNTLGAPTALQVAFEQHCEGVAAALVGELRYNASVPMNLLLPGSRTVSEGQPLHLPVNAESFDGNLVALSVLDLPAGASFLDHGDNTGALDWTPGIHQMGDYLVRFRGDNGHGSVDTVSSRIQVMGVTSLTVVSDSLDPVGFGGTYQYSSLDGAYTSNKNSFNGVTLSFRDSLFNTWGLEFAADSGLPLEVNVYNNAVGFPASPNVLPSLRISRNFGGCFDIAGRFVVRGVTYDNGNGVPSFWATFEQHCFGLTAGLRGEIRYNADVPLILTAPRTLVVSENERTTFGVRGLARPGARAALSTGRLPIGATFRDNGDNTGTFDWLPGFNQQGNYAIVTTAFDGLGAVDSTRTILLVKNSNRAPVASAGGPYHAQPGAQVSFDGSATRDPDGDPMDLLWDFGDGTHALGQQPQHAYAAAGIYTVVLFATDGLLLDIDSTTAVIDAHGPAAPAILAFVPTHAALRANVSVFGRTLAGTTSFTFNLSPARFTVVSDSLLRAIVPDSATTGLLRAFTAQGVATSRDSFVVDPGPVAPPCPRRRIAWREHPSEWPVSTLILGRLPYTQEALLQILRRSHGESETEQSLKLGAELVAAKLNVLIGVRAPAADRAIVRADSVIGARRIPFSVSGREHHESLFEELANTLRDFNRGQMTPGCRGAIAFDDEGEGADALADAVPGGLQISPNPFSGASRVRLAVSRESRVRIGVIDLQGREVRVLHSGLHPAGVLDVTWDGRDGSGHMLESGVYFCRIEGNGPVLLRKLVMLR